MNPPQVVRVLKRDLLGRVELLEGPSGRRIRRVAPRGVNPLPGILARYLMRRERRALGRLADVPGIARVLDDPECSAVASPDEGVPRAKDILCRSYLEGVPLYAAFELPRDFFERLEDLVCELHARGVCHNDLHKEPNVLVGPDGRPQLVDFQLASVHGERGRSFRVRAAEDLRHVKKHQRHYERALGVAVTGALGRSRPSLGALLWMRTGKPLYNLIVHRFLRVKPTEERRPADGPWPVWTEAIGPGPAPSPDRGAGTRPADRRASEPPR